MKLPSIRLAVAWRCASDTGEPSARRPWMRSSFSESVDTVSTRTWGWGVWSDRVRERERETKRGVLVHENWTTEHGPGHWFWQADIESAVTRFTLAVEEVRLYGRLAAVHPWQQPCCIVRFAWSAFSLEASTQSVCVCVYQRKRGEASVSNA